MAYGEREVERIAAREIVLGWMSGGLVCMAYI